jgi:hypothetical protein
MLRGMALVVALTTVASCSDQGPNLGLDGTYDLVSENGKPLPADPNDVGGCCITLAGSLTLDRASYHLAISYRNKNTSAEFANAEDGTFSRSGNTLTFVRTGGGGLGVPFLLGAGTVTQNQLTVPYGDEGPGSNQIVAIFRR